MIDIDIKKLAGVLNTDDPNESINIGHHKNASNIVFRGKDGDMIPEVIKGTNIISDNVPRGTNECIGRFYDNKKGRIFSFIYNSNNNHSIRLYTISNSVIVPLIEVGAQTDGDILNFTLDGKITAVGVLYGDDEQGDILYWNNSQKQPCCINIKKALAGQYGTIKRSFINVIKSPAAITPKVVYENDNTVTVNNLRKRLFLFRVRYVYIDNTKSVYSAMSAMPLPINYADTAVDKDPTKNCRIAIVIPTGEFDVKEIEIAATILPEENAVVGSDLTGFFTIASLNKSNLSIPDNDIYTYRFYNNQVYEPCDEIEIIQLQDLVPLEANAFALLNGNVPCYGGIKEFYNKTNILGSSSCSELSERTTQPYFIYTASQSGNSGFGAGNIHIIVLGSITVGDIFNIYTTNQTITYTATVATTANVISGLSAAAVIAGFTVVSSDSENLIITKTNESLLRYLSVPLKINVTDSFVYDRNARYNFGAEYFDGEGRTIGSETNSTLPVQTINYTETGGVPNIPKITVSILNRPPLNAAYFHITRSLNLSKLNKLEWVSDRTYKDSQYAYISIENLNAFILKNPSAKHLQFDFSYGDRIRFMKNLSNGINTIYVNNDFEIQSQVISPEINGFKYEGQFLKIVLPSTSGTFDFGTANFFNYFIELYTPAKSTADGLDKYFEFSERYAIGNAGTANAFHQGMLQNQSVDLLTPATFEFTQGDYYYRPRTINTAPGYIYNVVNGTTTETNINIGLTFVSADYTDPNIVTGSSPLASTFGWFLTDHTRYILHIVNGTFTFRIQGSLNMTLANFGEVYQAYFLTANADGTGQVKTYILDHKFLPQGFNSIPFDVTITLTTNQYLYILGAASNFNNSISFATSTVNITNVKFSTVNCIDPNFSDFFPSKTNSNGRVSIVDVNAAQVFNPTQLRWGLLYKSGSNINQTNRFREVNFDEVDRGKGQIQILDVEGMELRIIQYAGACRKAIYGKFIQDNKSSNILTTTDEILTKNNADYYLNSHGIGDYPLSFIKSGFAAYWVDPIIGEQIRLSQNGIISINKESKGQFYIKSLLLNYSSNYTRRNGSRSQIIQYFDYYENQCVTILQEGTKGNKTIPNKMLSWNEKRNAYCSFYETINGGFDPEMAIADGTDSFFWKNGRMYIQNDNTDNRNFLGTLFYPSITLVFNSNINIKKTFEAIAYQSNQFWVADQNGDITTSQPNEQTGLPQISQLKEVDFDISEGLYYAGFLNDANSSNNAQEALVNGDILKGVWVQVKLTYKGSKFAYLYLPYIKYDNSPRNL